MVGLIHFLHCFQMDYCPPNSSHVCLPIIISRPPRVPSYKHTIQMTTLYMASKYPSNQVTWLEGKQSLLYWSIVSITELTFSALLRTQKIIGYKTALSFASKQKDYIYKGARFWDLSTELRDVKACVFEDRGLNVHLIFYTPKAGKMLLT